MAFGQQEGRGITMLERIPTSAPFETVFLHMDRFPLARKDSAPLIAVLKPWLQKLADRLQLQPALWLQGKALHTPETVNLLVEHARDWMPDLGLGIRPGGEPPRMLNAEDLNQLKRDQMPRPKHETACFLMNGAETALPLFFGTGAVIYCLLSASAEVYLKEQGELWLPTIQDPAFRAHPFYLPLLDCKSLENQPSSTLEQWMGRAVFYLRESPENGGVLIVSSISEALEQLELDLQHQQVPALGIE